MMHWQFEKVRQIAMAAVTDDQFTEYPIEWRDVVINRFSELPDTSTLLPNTDKPINLNFATYEYEGKVARG